LDKPHLIHRAGLGSNRKQMLSISVQAI